MVFLIIQYYLEKKLLKREMHMKMFLMIMLASFLLTSCTSMVRMMGMIPMGSSEDVEDSKQLWKVLEKEKMVGKYAEKIDVYEGTAPHGKFLETDKRKITVNGRKGLVIVKKNYGGPGITEDKVNENRKKWLKAVTVMFKREKGYDSDNKDWFWAKFTPNGGLHEKNKMGGMVSIALAGRVAKGKKQGCIHCHASAAGGDYMFLGTYRE